MRRFPLALPWRNRGLPALAVAAALLVPWPAAAPAQAALTLHAPAYGQRIPQRFTCDGAGLSPPLQWSHVPPGTKSLVFILKDPDAPSGTFTHWLLYNIPPGVRRLPAHAAESGLPHGTRVGRNSAGDSGYYPPCPPSGTHRYVHELYALDTRLPDLHHPDRPALLRAMQGHVLGRARLTRPYTRGH